MFQYCQLKNKLQKKSRFRFVNKRISQNKRQKSKIIFISTYTYISFISLGKIFIVHKSNKNCFNIIIINFFYSLQINKL